MHLKRIREAATPDTWVSGTQADQASWKQKLQPDLLEMQPDSRSAPVGMPVCCSLHINCNEHFPRSAIVNQ